MMILCFFHTTLELNSLSMATNFSSAAQYLQNGGHCEAARNIFKSGTITGVFKTPKRKVIRYPYHRIHRERINDCFPYQDEFRPPDVSCT